MFQQVDYGFLPPPDPGPWLAFKKNLVSQDPAALCRARRSWEDLKEASGSPFTRDPSLTSLCGGTQATVPRVSALRFTSSKTSSTASPGRAVAPSFSPSPKPGISNQNVTASPQLAPQAVNPTSGATSMVSTTRAGSLSSLSLLGAGIGSIIPGAGTILGGSIGGAIGALGSLGKSRCPGPYNYDPVTGGCVPKPSSLVAGGVPSSSQQCPSGTTYDPASGQCKVGGISGTIQRTLPGGKTGYTSPIGTSWTPTSAFGTQGFVPQSVPSSYLTCPKGFVLFGKEPGMEVCLPKGMFPNKYRKWPKPASPALSSRDMKTLNKINSLQRKISGLAMKAGYQKPRKR